MYDGDDGFDGNSTDDQHSLLDEETCSITFALGTNVMASLFMETTFSYTTEFEEGENEEVSVNASAPTHSNSSSTTSDNITHWHCPTADLPVNVTAALLASAAYTSVLSVEDVCGVHNITITGVPRLDSSANCSVNTTISVVGDLDDNLEDAIAQVCKFGLWVFSITGKQMTICIVH